MKYTKPNGNLVDPEIIIGESICIKIKAAFYENIPWGACHNQVANKFTEFKSLSSKAFPGLDKLSFLRELSKFTLKDIIETFTDMK